MSLHLKNNTLKTVLKYIVIIIACAIIAKLVHLDIDELVISIKKWINSK